MILVVLSGGIGSQLFQYAAGYSLAKEKKCRLLLDYSFFFTKESMNLFKLDQVIHISDEIFIKNIWLSRLIRIWFGILSYSTFFKIKYERIDIKNPFELEIFPDASNYFINGYPNNIEYVYKNLDEILGKFKTNKSYNNKIKIGIHIRKGDFVNTELDVCGSDYYNRAIKEIIKQNKLNLSNVEIIIFCQELAWPKENIKIEGAKLKFIIGNHETAAEDFKKMSNCTHLIMANSTYSWWAAARINNVLGGMIVCPDLWWDKISVNKINIYPQGWKVLATNVLPREYKINI